MNKTTTGVQVDKIVLSVLFRKLLDSQPKRCVYAVIVFWNVSSGETLLLFCFVRTFFVWVNFVPVKHHAVVKMSRWGRDLIRIPYRLKLSREWQKVHSIRDATGVDKILTKNKITINISEETNNKGGWLKNYSSDHLCVMQKVIKW